MTRISRPSRSRFLDPGKIKEALAQAGYNASQHDTRIALAGGCALQLYGSDRFTRDIDLVADGYVLGLPKKGMLSFGGMRTIAPNGVPIDVIVRSDQYAELYANALADAQEMRGVAVPVVTLPYLAAMKLVAGRGKDFQDLEFILCDSGESTRKIRDVVSRHLGIYAADEIDSIKALARWQRKKGNGR